MQVQTFAIPALGGTDEQAEANRWLRSHRVLEVRTEFVQAGTSSFWAVFVSYLEGKVGTEKDQKPRRVDYKQVLQPCEFERFAALRDWRRAVAKEGGIPAYAVFTDRELADIVKLETFSPETIRSVEGVGEGKFERYGADLLAHLGQPQAEIET